jgi:hypothetical protein
MTCGVALVYPSPFNSAAPATILGFLAFARFAVMLLAVEAGIGEWGEESGCDALGVEEDVAGVGEEGEVVD